VDSSRSETKACNSTSGSAMSAINQVEAKKNAHNSDHSHIAKIPARRKRPLRNRSLDPDSAAEDVRLYEVNDANEYEQPAKQVHSTIGFTI